MNSTAPPGEGKLSVTLIAQQYHSRGFVPLALPPRSKRPKQKGWQKRRLSDGLPTFEPTSNIGVLLGEPSGWLVDVDLDHPLAVERADQFLPPTQSVFGREGKRQSHRLYVARGAVTQKRQVTIDGQKIMLMELRSTGGQTVFPGSIHPSGERIEWHINGDPSEIDADKLLAAANALADEVERQLGIDRTKPARNDKGTHNVTLLTDAIHRARKYVGRMPPAISGRGGHDATFNVACELFRFGLGDDHAAALLTEYNQRCEPPWSDGELHHKLADAKERVRGDGEFGCRAAKSKSHAAKVSATASFSAGDGAMTILNSQTRTDTGNARRFARLHGNNVRWCDPWGKWLVWDGRRWALDETRRVERLAKDVSAALFVEIGASMTSMSDRDIDAATKFAKASANERSIRAFLSLAKSEDGIALLPDVFDRDPLLLNVKNGTLDLRTNELREHRREDYLMKLASCTFDPQANCPTWQRFVNEVFAGNEKLVEFFRRAIGYTLTGQTVERCVFFCYGTGRNGKTTAVSTVQKLLGDYATTFNTSALMVSAGQQHPTELTDLAGRRMAVANETEDGRRFAESLLKQLTGGEDRIKARRMREDMWEFSATHKLWLAGNHKPRIRGTDPAIWDRIRLILFSVRFEHPDKTLAKQLEVELPGILNWALVGCLDWQSKGLAEPLEVQKATADYRIDMDTLGAFLADECEAADGESIAAAELFAAYRKWCEAAGERPLGQREFGTQLTERGYKRSRATVWSQQGPHDIRGVASEG